MMMFKFTTTLKCVYIYIVVLMTSLCINAIFIATTGLFEYRAWRLRKIESQPSPVLLSKDDFRNQLTSAAMDFFHGKGDYVYMHKVRGSIRETFKMNCHGDPLDDRFLYSEPAYLLYVTLCDAIKYNNTERIKDIENLFCENVIDKTPIRVDQCMQGAVAIELYKLTSKKKYKIYADNMYLWLKERSKNNEFGIRYCEAEFNLCDGIGMYNPFLCLYSKTFGCKEAYNIALNEIELWNRYGVDCMTGIPCHGYRIKEPHLKFGSSDWGRGCSWYAIGLLDIEKYDLSDTTKVLVGKFEDNILAIWKQQGTFSQTISVLQKEDLSATLPLLYYLKTKKLVRYNDRQILEYSKYMHKGFMYHSSGYNSGAIGYSPFSGANILTQAFMIKLLNN